MAGKDSSVLGIDLHEQEIRVVQISYRSNKPTLGKIGRAPMPDGAVMGGRILHTGPVAVALRLLLNSMGIGSAARVVVGLLGDGTILRTMSVPPVPDHELPTIIAGEVNHYGLVHTEGGAYSYLRLQPHNRSAGDTKGALDPDDKRETRLDPDAGNQNPAVVTVFAVEEEVLYSIRDTIEQANLAVESIEPTQYAMFRSVMMAAGPNGTLFAMMISPANTDVAFVNKGVIVGYRRIDIGSRLLTLEYGTSTDSPGSPAPSSLEGNPYSRPTTQPKTGGSESSLNRLAIESLSLEIQRTLNYYQREFPTAPIEEHVYLAVDDARVEGLAKELTLSLGVSVEAMRPSLTAQESHDSGHSASALSPVYSAAFGLAQQGQVLGRVPRIDLFSKQRAGVQQAEAQRNFWGSIVTSIVAVVIGFVIYVMFHRQIVTTRDETNKLIARTLEIRGQFNEAVQQRHRREKQYEALRSEGVPITEIMDYISSSVSGGAGLDSVSITSDLSVTIMGQSGNEKQMIDTVEALQKCPILSDVRIVRFNELPPEQGVGDSFEIMGKTVSEGRIRLPAATAPAATPAPGTGTPGTVPPATSAGGLPSATRPGPASMNPAPQTSPGLPESRRRMRGIAP